MPSNPITAITAVTASKSTSWLTRPVVQVETLVLTVSLYMLLVGNGPFWRAALKGRLLTELSTWTFAAAVLVFFAAVYCLFALAVSNRLTVKPIMSVLILVTAFAAWYMSHYAIYLDRAMLRNVLATDVKEAGDLLTWGMAPSIVWMGVLPAALVWWPRLAWPGWQVALKRRAIWLLGSAAIGALAIWLVFADFASLMRNHGEVRHLMTPGNAVVSLVGATFGKGKTSSQPKLVVGSDAHLGASWAARKRPVLFVMVVGETARAQNFSLNGYARQTNAELAKKDVINFSNATACGTSTAVSLPCMFSPFGRADYDEEKIATHESFLQVLQRAGLPVLWRDNQSGCKGVCDGVKTEQLDRAGVESLCAEGQCFDEILLHGLDAITRDAAGNLFVVMHQMGSHGPAYFKRYPPAFKRFTPACETEDLRLCTPAEITNAYDNSLAYTDFVLGRLIDFLNAQTRYDTAMLYMSDHGESLGENGLYLHGMPYAIAPDVQKRVPLVMWLSAPFRQNFGIDESCLRARAGQAASHDNLFHSVLGVLDVKTVAYRRSLDLFAPCRPG